MIRDEGCRVAQQMGAEMTFMGELVSALTARGFGVAEDFGTGGGCTALAVWGPACGCVGQGATWTECAECGAARGPNGRHVLVTDGNYGTDVESTGEIIACVYDTPEADGTLIADMAVDYPGSERRAAEIAAVAAAVAAALPGTVTR